MDKYSPFSMNIELTTKCPLRCPQCYCSLEGGKDIDLETAIYWIKEGGKMGVRNVELSGGESLCYPHLYELVKAVKEYCGNANIALSGYNFTQEVYDKLVEAGISGIFVSLNGSKEEINSKTRDGYNLAISALELLRKNKFANTIINWVMHSSNADDFQNMITLAEKYDVSAIVVIAVKPDSRHNLSTIPSKEQMNAVKDIIHNYKGKVKIGIESCFSPMLALASDTKLFGNMNIGKYKGCSAGRYTFSVSVDGKLSPCRHLEYYEQRNTLEEYWNKSEILKKLRAVDEEPEEPCKSCRFMDYCRPCAAVNSKLEGKLYRGNKYCVIAEQ